MTRKFLIFFSLVIFTILINTNCIKAETKSMHDRDSSIYRGFKPHTSLFYSIDFGSGNIETSGSFNNWMINNGYGKNIGYSFTNGASCIGFKNNWMTEGNEQFQNIGSTGQIQIVNLSLGEGYKIISSKICSVYGVLSLGVNNLDITPDQSIINDYSKYNQPSGSYLTQYFLLLNPHLMLYKNITKNMSRRPDFLSKIGLGIVAGYNVTILPGSWLYGYSDSRPFYAVRVDGIPYTNSNGIYFLGKIGWNFGKE